MTTDPESSERRAGAVRRLAAVIVAIAALTAVAVALGPVAWLRERDEARRNEQRAFLLLKQDPVATMTPTMSARVKSVAYPPCSPLLDDSSDQGVVMHEFSTDASPQQVFDDGRRRIPSLGWRYVRFRDRMQGLDEGVLSFERRLSKIRVDLWLRVERAAPGAGKPFVVTIELYGSDSPVC